MKWTDPISALNEESRRKVACAIAFRCVPRSLRTAQPESHTLDAWADAFPVQARGRCNGRWSRPHLETVRIRRAKCAHRRIVGAYIPKEISRYSNPVVSCDAACVYRVLYNNIARGRTQYRACDHIIGVSVTRSGSISSRVKSAQLLRYDGKQEDLSWRRLKVTRLRLIRFYIRGVPSISEARRCDCKLDRSSVTGKFSNISQYIIGRRIDAEDHLPYVYDMEIRVSKLCRVRYLLGGIGTSHIVSTQFEKRFTVSVISIRDSAHFRHFRSEGSSRMLAFPSARYPVKRSSRTDVLLLHVARCAYARGKTRSSRCGLSIPFPSRWIYRPSESK